MSSIIELSDIDDYNEKDLIKMRENNSDSENELESEETLAFFTSQLRVPKVIYTTVPIEYPDTSSEGVATVYNVTGWKNHTDAFSDIQYSTNGSGGTTNIQECSFFGGIPVKKNQRKCQGIKFCQFTDPELINQEHCSVDFDSEIFQHYIQQNNNNTKEAKTYTLFLAAKDTPCNFKKDNIPCNGGPHIGRITNYQMNIVLYFIGCNKYKQGDKWHRYIKIKQDEVDISLLQSLFTGSASVQDTVKCSMILSKSCKRKKCDMPHTHNGTIVREEIIDKPCQVRFIKFIPYDIVKCPFVALVCVGTHNHPPPAPERIPSGIKNNLESLITQAIQQDDNVTSRSILSGNLLSAYFNKETLAEVHVSLNNIDKLRYLVGKAYKTLHPFGQGVIGIYHDILNPKSDLINYVRKIDLYSNNGQVIITCMLDNQAKKLITLDYFQIDVSFKRVKGEINEFEINMYDSKHHLIEQVHDLLQQIEDTNDEGIKEWLNYYRQSYVLSSLNKYVSNVDHEIWNKSRSDTNNAKAAHSMANREGKQLKLLSAILKDKSDVKRLQNSIVRKTSRIQKNKVSLNDKLPKSSKKRKLSPSNSRTPIRSKENHERAENILSDNEEETFSKEIHKKNLELELKEKEIILREREIKTRVAEAEARMMEAKAEALEIENQQKR
ncbi:hypothetical protein RhiirC2_823058 [Rhizophagus irregularis]|uniref:Uncharacterized protein n=1 Tax=Rhizophagus irregularis TaxID=588596 RepID=A0A2N1NI92_9GLOM|nr:hypothetical protein RhiirC2_823058 [Rhizophagus irregularis]